jgi:hypothetical protein
VRLKLGFMKSYFNIFGLLLLLSAGTSCGSQKSTLWTDFKESKKKSTEPILPDFSYTGYHYSEIPIPTVEHPVFNVTDYGANPDDSKSDKAAIKFAISRASANGKGIVFFPAGKYLINTAEDDLNESIVVASSHIVLRGENTGTNRTTLFFENEMPPTDPDKLWSSPYAITTLVNTSDQFLTDVISNAKRETFSLRVADASEIKTGQWLVLKVQNNHKDLIASDLGSLKPEPEWTAIFKSGVLVHEIHQVAKVEGNKIIFKEPIHYDVEEKYGWKLYTFNHLEEVGFENLVFEGNWDREFVHHRSVTDDGGWSILKFNRVIHSWVKDCTFRNVNRPLTFNKAAVSTALNITVEGKIGHSSVAASGGSMGILIALVTDKAGMHHAAGVGGGSTTGTVIWRSKHPSHTSFESHASQPRCTLFDQVSGGFFQGRAGGARFNLPNHGKYLVLWNYEETDEAEENFGFVATDSHFWKFAPPIIVGFHGTGTTFKRDEVQVQESIGKPVKPESLFEEQLKLRLGKLPGWIKNLKSNLL